MFSLKLASAQIGVHNFGLVEKTVAIYPEADVYAFNDYSRSQLKFDITTIPSGSTIVSAKLWLFRFAADNWDGNITVYRVDDQLWSENITADEFNAQTLTDGENSTGKFMMHGWDSINVFNQLKVDRDAGLANVSLRLLWEGDDGKEPSVGIDDNRFLLIGSKLDNLTIFLNSKEFDGNAPYLEVTYDLLYAVSASISPAEGSGSPGGTLKYTVTITNTGDALDNYTMVVNDNAIPTWAPTLDDYVLGPISVGGSASTTLHINIPNLPGTTDNITVTAISQAESTVRDDASCIAQALTAPPQPPSPSPPAPTDNTPPPTPSLISPTNGENMIDNTPLFNWSDVNDPSGVTYELSIARDARFSSGVVLKNGIAASTYTLIPAEALTPGQYYWRIRAVDGAGNVGSWSENWSFTVNPIPPAPTDNTPPPTPSLISPTNGENMIDNTPLFNWSDVNDPSGVTYELSIANDAGFVSIVLAKSGLTLSTYKLISDEALPAGTYYWRIRAIDGAGNVGSWSENWSFTVSQPLPPSGPTEILLVTAILLILAAIIAAIALYAKKSHVYARPHRKSLLRIRYIKHKLLFAL
jgi:hypothetical protein